MIYRKLVAKRPSDGIARWTWRGPLTAPSNVTAPNISVPITDLERQHQYTSSPLRSNTPTALNSGVKAHAVSIAKRLTLYPLGEFC
jgi:hypothetical protein